MERRRRSDQTSAAAAQASKLSAVGGAIGAGL